MADHQARPGRTAAPSPDRRLRRLLAVLALVLALAVGGAVLVARLGGDDSIGPSPTSVQTPAATAESAPSGRPSPTATGAPQTSPPGTPTTPPRTPSSTRASAPTPTSARPVSPGNDPRPPATRSPVPIEAPAEVQPGLRARITDLESVEGEAQGPGEVGGPAVRFRLLLENASAQERPLSTTVVNLYYGPDRTPAAALVEPGGAPLPPTVAAGSQATGTYLFVVPPAARGEVLITVDYSVDVSLVAFRGAAPR